MSEIRNPKSVFIIVILSILTALSSQLSMALFAQEPPTITISKGDRINLTVSPISGGEGAAVTATLQNDLTLSGYFTLTGSAAYTAHGSANGGNLQGQVVDHGGGTVLSKSYSGSAHENAHRFADDIIETLTGNKGFATSKIAFIATRSGKKEVYVADYDGSNARHMTASSACIHRSVRMLAGSPTPVIKAVIPTFTGSISGAAREIRSLIFPERTAALHFRPMGIGSP